MTEPALLTFAEACEYLRVSAKTARGFIADGDLKAAKIGNVWRVRRRDLEAFVEASIHHPPAPRRGRGSPAIPLMPGALPGEKPWETGRRLDRERRAARRKAGLKSS